MMSRDKLLQLIENSEDYITTKDAEAYGIHREYLSLFVKEENLIRVSPGVYQKPGSWDDFLFEFQKKKKRVIYSHDTALYLHGLSDRDPIIYSVTVPTGYNTSQINSQRIISYTIKKDLFDLGKMILKTNFGNEVFVYDKERTLCDVVRSRSKLDKQIVNDALKMYVNDKSRNLNKLMQYAEALGIQSVIRNYLEILL
jgi:predicted transcriptional regulator of viral defense system